MPLGSRHLSKARGAVGRKVYPVDDRSAQGKTNEEEDLTLRVSFVLISEDTQNFLCMLIIIVISHARG